MQPPELTDAIQSFGKKICAAIAPALTDASDSSWELAIAGPATVEEFQDPNGIHFHLSFEGSMEGEAILSVDDRAISQLALRIEAVESSDIRETQKAALLGALRKGVAGLEKSLAEHGAVLISVDVVEAPKLQDMRGVELSASCKEPRASVPFAFYVGKKLEIVLSSAQPRPFSFPQASGPTAANLDLVLDVELSVTLRFGQRQLALREVLELTSGSVVELDRQVDEPVELVLDGRVVARGEAVVVDGNYGMRITQVLQPLEFLR